tara:strand:+ start:1280 stop:1663 length:384 start_codon:yes stop_codon:yes gene_type:complete
VEWSEFLFWGMFGMTVEVCFTALRKRKLNLIGHTSIWMFPIYALGLTYGFEFIHYCVPDDIPRYLSYPFWIWGVEILFGGLGIKLGIRAWDYHYLPDSLHWRGLISFIHYPLWVGFGILVEMIKLSI